MSPKTLLLFLFATWAFISCFGPVRSATVLEILETDFPDFYEAILNDTEQVERFNGTQITTVFASNISSSSSLPGSVVDYHSINKTIRHADLADGLLLDTLLVMAVDNSYHQKIKITGKTGDFNANNAKISSFEKDASNGVVLEVASLINEPDTVSNIIKSRAELSTLAGLFQKGNWSLLNTKAVTLFAPTDNAFKTFAYPAFLPYLDSEEGEEDRDNLLQFHIGNAPFYENTASAGTHTIVTYDNGLKLTVEVGGGKFVITEPQNATVVLSDILAASGVIHEIDEVLLPSNVEVTLEKLLKVNFADFVAAFNRTGLSHLLTGTTQHTIFVPKNFKDSTDITEDLLKYHVISGSYRNTDFSNGELIPTLATFGGLVGRGLPVKITASAGKPIQVNGIAFENSDVLAQNGVFHVIEDSLSLPGDLLDVVHNLDAKDFSSFKKAVNNSAAFTALLHAGGNTTIFIPTDAAFAKLPAGISNYLFNNSRDLTTVLSLHALMDEVLYSTDLHDGEGGAFITAEGEDLYIENINGTISVNGSDLDSSRIDILAINGVAHALDDVLIPKNPDRFQITVEEIFEGLQAVAFEGAALKAGLFDTIFRTNESITIFTPTNAAFADASKNLKDASNDTLKMVLSSHIVMGAVDSFKNVKSLKAINGNILVISTDKAGQNYFIKINGTKFDPTPITLPGNPTINAEPIVYVYSINRVLGEPGQESSSGGLSSTEIGLIVAGCIVAVLIAGAVVGGAVWYYKKRSDYTEIHGDTF